MSNPRTSRLRRGGPLGLLGVLWAWLLCMALPLPAEALEMIERRQDQFPTEPAYLILPAPYSLPGIGQGIFVIAYVSNLLRTPTDAYGYLITGDAQGYGLGVSEVQLWPKTVLFDAFREQIDKAQIFQYPSRGMDTRKDDYHLVDVSHVVTQGGTLTLTLFDRRLELSYSGFSQRAQVDSFRDPNGTLLQKLEKPITVKSSSQSLGLLLDDTDDRWDPRKGVRLGVVRRHSPPQDDQEPDYYVVNTELKVYIPIGKQSTWAFDLFQSQAEVTREGGTNPAVIAQQVCPTLDPACLAAPSTVDYVTNALAANTQGTADSLGGRNRLRAYPEDRFKGACMAYVGTELRLNLTEETTPFDYWIWKDVRTNVQLALIAETGTVAESASQLWDRQRSDYGVGLRMVTASGGVYRADWVTGDEGPQTTIIVEYPW